MKRVLAHCPHGLMVLDADDVALLRDEGTGRVEVTAADGAVGHCPGPLRRFGRGPWVPVASGVLAHPAHARRVDGGLAFAGGWHVPFEGDLPRPAPPNVEPLIAALGVRPHEVLYVRGTRDRIVWVTDCGPVRRGGTLLQAARLHPDLHKVGAVFVNLRRLRMVAPGRVPRMILDDGAELRMTYPARLALYRALKIPSIDFIIKQAPPRVGALYQLGLRDFPTEIARASATQLEAWFGRDERALIANLLWQTVRWRRAGRVLDYEISHRGFWYHPLLPVLVRAGFTKKVEPIEVAWTLAHIPIGWPKRGPFVADDHFLYYGVVLTDLVKTYQVFTYADLGFEDPRPHLRIIGATRPEIVLAVEKSQVERAARALRARFDCSMIILGGDAKLIDTENFVAALRKKTTRAVHVIAYVDYDPYGWWVAKGFAQQLKLYGIKVRKLSWLVVPSMFTPAELRTAALPVIANGPKAESLVARWMRETGGIDGERKGIHCDYMQDVERLEERMKRALAPTRSRSN